MYVPQVGAIVYDMLECYCNLGISSLSALRLWISSCEAETQMSHEREVLEKLV